MKRLAATLSLAAFCIGTAGDLSACGDKFLVVGRGTRYKHPNAPRGPAFILIYADPASSLALALKNVPVESTLRRAGYTPKSVDTAEQLGDALARGGWDLVVVDQADGERVRAMVAGDSPTVVLPVFYNATRAELKAAKKRYPVLLESPSRSQAFLETVDDALALRPRAAAESSGKAPA